MLHDEIQAESGVWASLLTGGGPAAVIAADALSVRHGGLNGGERPVLVASSDGPADLSVGEGRMVRAGDVLTLTEKPLRGQSMRRGLLLAHGGFAPCGDTDGLAELLKTHDADVLCVRVDPSLAGGGEKVRVTQDNDVVGFRRLYADVVFPETCGDQWPHYVRVKANALKSLVDGGGVPLDFGTFVDRCEKASLEIAALRVGGAVLDLRQDDGVLALLTEHVQPAGNPLELGCGARLFGKVMIGKGVRIGANAIVVGPTILNDHVTIGEGAVVRSSVIGGGVTTSRNGRVENRIMLASNADCEQATPGAATGTSRNRLSGSTAGQKVKAFCRWPWWSYGGIWKRLLDVAFAATVLLLCAPVLIIIAAVVKLTSRGPVFYAHRRQGLHGKEFNCVKFRTMVADADNLQDLLRAKNQVDGPQFKMENDPRISVVGRFLRDTCIDEIPQFFNVLAGQMSVVGPRPSPEKENTLCAYWRDTRLSVRPGITGLWQVARTRQEGQDFQEWVAYDTRYVRSLSLGNDVKICWLTVKQLFGAFVRQF